jgi:hypothetical protein
MNAQLRGHEEIIANYGNCPSQLEAALLGLSEINLDLRTSAEGWAIREIVHHIADGDDMWKMFIKQAIGNPDSEFFLNWYWQEPQDAWAKSWNYNERLIEPSLAMFRAIGVISCNYFALRLGLWKRGYGFVGPKLESER